MAKKNLPAVPQLISPRMVGVKQASAFLGTTAWAMRNLVWDKKIPHMRIGARLLFDIQDLEKFIATNKVPARA